MFDVLLFLLCASVASAADFTITTQPAGPELVGFGGQMNPYLYCKPNDISEASAKNFENKVIDLAPQHVRIFYLQRWFGGAADPISEGDPRTADSFIRTCKLAQAAGATINVTNWYGPWVDVHRQMNEFADTLRRLIIDEKLTAIRYITIQNEPNLHEDKIKKELLTQLYLELDAALQKRNIRDRLKIISGDLVGDNQREWFPHIGATLSSISDGYSIHVYWDYWDTAKLQRRISEVPPIVAELPREQQRPLYVTEFGVRGHKKDPKIEPGDYEDGTPIAMKPLQANELTWFMMEALNRGYVATVIWTLEDAWYDRLMPYGLIGSVKSGWPLKPSYHMVRLFTHTCHPGWHAMKIEGESEGKIVSAARGPKDELSVYALNQTKSPVVVTIAGLPAGAVLHAIGWNSTGNGTLAPAKDVTVSSAGEVHIRLAALELKALTSESTAGLIKQGKSN